MALDDDLMFIAEEAELSCKNGQPILNLPIYFENSDGTDFPFPAYVSAYLNIYQGKGETLLKSYTSQLTRNSAIIVLNLSASDMTFGSFGKYYYELGYVYSGGYTVLLRFGNFTVQ